MVVKGASPPSHSLAASRESGTLGSVRRLRNGTRGKSDVGKLFAIHTQDNLQLRPQQPNPPFSNSILRHPTPPVSTHCTSPTPTAPLASVSGNISLLSKVARESAALLSVCISLVQYHGVNGASGDVFGKLEHASHFLAGFSPRQPRTFSFPFFFPAG